MEWAERTRRRVPFVGITLMPEPAFLSAAAPLVEVGDVECLEWNLELGWTDEPLPPLCADWLAEFGRRGRLLGHGVSFSLLSGAWTERHARWLERLELDRAERRYRHVSEHFGFLGGGAFAFSAPYPVPLTDATVALGVERLRRLRRAAGVPVGLENLAFAFGRSDVERQGEFLRRLLAPVDGFLVLDLHNLHCQAENFRLPLVELMEAYPLERVRELHLSGGSAWRGLRRDTHDAAVPEALFAALPDALRRCRNVEAIVVERLGATLRSGAEADEFRAEVRRVRSVVHDGTVDGRAR